jgi:integrase
MGKFISGLGCAINAMLDYREALGFSRNTHVSNLMNFDNYCAQLHPDETSMSKDMVLGWIHRELNKPRSNINSKTGSVRILAKYFVAIGRDAYVLPDDYASRKTVSSPYIFTDAELEALFDAIDRLPKQDICISQETHKSGSNALNHSNNDATIAPVLFRLIYTCGLRPEEGRKLECVHVNLHTGEIFITKTKQKKERLVVMSDDMLAMCRKYDQWRKAFGAGVNSKYFFPNQDGEAYASQRLDRLIKRCWALANPSVSSDELPNIRVYDLRHRFASAILNRWLDEGCDLYNKLPYLRTYMGHRNMSETAYYIHILPENLLKSAGIDWTALESLIPNAEVRP